MILTAGWVGGHPLAPGSKHRRHETPVAESQSRIPPMASPEEARMMLGVRIGVCSDVHGRHDRLLTVLDAMATAGVDERWCLGDLVGSDPVTPELVGAARQLDLLIAGNHDAWALGWGTASTVPFVVLLVVLVPLLRSQADRLPAEAGTTLRHLAWVFLFFWGLYPIGYLVPVASFTPEGAVLSQALFTAADIGSKVLYGVLLAKVLRLRSAADGYGPAREPADGAVGERPEDEPYPSLTEPVRAGNP